MARTQLSTRTLGPRQSSRLSATDSLPRKAIDLSRATDSGLAAAAGVSAAAAKRVIAARKAGPLGSLIEAGLSRAEAEQVQRIALMPDDTRLVIENVTAIDHILSDRPFALRVSFRAGRAAKPLLVSAIVQWAGQPFVVEKRVSPTDAGNGRVDLRFGPQQTLPTGGVTFYVSLFGANGAQSSFRTSYAVLPSNPFSLQVSPDVDFVTGTFSARAVRSGSKFVTHVRVRLSNGDGSKATIPGSFTWKFWDGGVGGSLVEQGTGSFGSSISVGAHSLWDGFIAFTSPSGSGVFDKLNGRDDLTLQIIMQRPGGGTVTGSITVRTMFTVGLNITRVSFEAFTATEETDLAAAVVVTQQIYARRDMAVTTDNRGIHQKNVGGYEIITSENEARDLFDDWSGPDTNHNIDVFVVQSISGTGFDGLAGDIPGPTSHKGRKSGVVVDKHGFVDASGTKHLDVDYHGMVMAHEVGHYLGLSHVNEAHNLMLPNSDRNDTNLNYDPQYLTIIKHGWVNIS